ncbi:MAG: hypothetical protein V3R25_10325 [Nitrosomonadaceae bacterium]
MTLLTIVQDALNEIGDTEVPASIVANPNRTAKQTLALANRSLLETARRLNWQYVSKTETLTTIINQEEYDLPSDFSRMVDTTFWNAFNRRRVFGAITPQLWARYQNLAPGATIAQFYRIFQSATGTGLKVRFYPLPGEAVDLSYEYISNGLVEDTLGVVKPKFTADDDVSLLDEDCISLGVKWRFLKSKGYPYAEEFRDYELAILDRGKAHGAEIVDLSGADRFNKRIIIIPDGGFGQ